MAGEAAVSQGPPPRPFFETKSTWRIADDVVPLRAFIHDVGQRDEEHFREIERQMREVFQDVEDLRNTLNILKEEASETNFLRRAFVLWNRRLSIRKELVTYSNYRLAPMVNKAKMELDRMHTGNRSSSSVEKKPTKENQVPSIRGNNIVGFEEYEEIIINHLMEDTDELEVVPITGMPGIGKTTLASKICQNDRVVLKFSTPIWIHVSGDQFNLRNVLRAILKELTDEDISSMNEEDLTQSIRVRLENRMFLLVIDAIWNVDSLESILNKLPKKAKMGKVLITSCNSNVCTCVNVIRKPHVLRLLDAKKSWEMLQLQVFGKLDDCPLRLKSIGKCIAKNCDGLPLAVEVIGSSLVVASSTKSAIDLSEKWWRKVSENVMMYVREYGQGRINGSIALSYNKMSVQLRNCFLYFGMFPEDYEISAWTLTRLWTTEGFIEHEEMAEQFLVDLIDRNLVMVGKASRLDGKVKTCRVHKVIHGFCKSKAAELNFYQEMEMSTKGDLHSIPPNCRRLCIYTHLLEFLSGKPNVREVRSFLCLNNNHILLDPKHSTIFGKSFHFLRIMESNCIKFAKFPIRLTKLIHLRYIALSSRYLDLLPKAISKLLNLETLVVNTQSHSLNIRANIWRMIRLRHLVTKAAIILTMERNGGSGQNKRLETLSNLSPECCTDDMSRVAPTLKKLGIRGKLATLLNAPEALSKLECLENLTLLNDLPYDSTPNNPLQGLLRSNFFPPNLKCLTLSATCLGWEHMSMLGTIVTLEFLKLRNNAFVGATWNMDPNGFSRLRAFSIKTADLVSWEASIGCFPSLLRLVLRKCKNLKKVPTSLAESVEILDMDHVTRSAIESARE